MTRPRRRVYVHLTSTGPQETPDPFERGLVGFSRCHRTSHITRTLRVEARLASLVLRHLVRGVLLAPLAVGLLRFRHLFDRETVIILGQSLRAIFARALKRCDARGASRAETPSTPTRRRGKRRRVISFSRSFTYVHHFSHTGAPQRGVRRCHRATSTSTSTSTSLEETILGHNPRAGSRIEQIRARRDRGGRERRGRRTGGARGGEG